MANSINSTDVKRIIFACEAGMGSSVMSVNSLKKKLKKAGVEGVEVVHVAARNIPEDAQVVIVHKGMSKLALAKAPNGVVLAFNQFLNDPIFDKVVAAFVAKEVITSNVG
jgi:mannitol-specific phosphotransferase system IIBC component